jgi:hypothetical protein
VESSGSNDPMGTSVTSLSMSSSWQLAEPLAVAGVLLNERQAQVFLPGSSYLIGESGVADATFMDSVTEEPTAVSPHDTSPGSPRTPDDSPVV